MAFFCTKAFASGDSIKELSDLQGFESVGVAFYFSFLLY